jgi:hypothetical protein
MIETLVGITVFVCLSAASLGVMHYHPRLPDHHRNDETNATIRLIANIFVVMTSLVFGLMLNASKNTFEDIDDSVHTFATKMILLDRTLRTYGLAGRDARERLIAYVEEAIAHPARAQDAVGWKPGSSERALDLLGDTLMTIQPSDDYHESLILDLRQQYRQLVEQRWALIEQSEGVIPRPLITLLIAWLILIFGTFGYRAPRNRVVVISFLVSAFLIGWSFNLVLDMDIPFTGLIQVSDAPLHRALAEMQQ